MSMNIVVPQGFFGASQLDTTLIAFLRTFAETHKEDKGDWAEKYGTRFENDKFMMHPFCWCERDDCPWCTSDKIELSDELKAQSGFDDDMGAAPNFWYKPLDFKVWWYKYIGRGMDTNKALTESEFRQMIADNQLPFAI